jgi:hypothetical protein
MGKMKLRDYKAISGIKSRWQFLAWLIKTKEFMILVVLILAAIIVLQILGFNFSIFKISK